MTYWKYSENPNAPDDLYLIFDQTTVTSTTTGDKEDGTSATYELNSEEKIITVTWSYNDIEDSRYEFKTSESKEEQFLINDMASGEVLQIFEKY